MQASFDAAMAQKQALEDDATATQRKMDSANALLSALAGEEGRWTQQSKEFDDTIQKLTGERQPLMLSLCFIGFCSHFKLLFENTLQLRWVAGLRVMYCSHCPVFLLPCSLRHISLAVDLCWDSLVLLLCYCQLQGMQPHADMFSYCDVGDCAIASSFVSYLGPFNKEFRELLITRDFYGGCVKLNIPVTKDMQVTKFLVDDSEVGEWTLQVHNQSCKPCLSFGASACMLATQ